MSLNDNHRRGEDKRTEHGPRWEGGDNSKCCARARSARKRLVSRRQRRTIAKPPREA